MKTPLAPTHPRPDLWFVRSSTLTGREAKLYRTLIESTQAQLAREVGITKRSVIRHEKFPDKVVSKMYRRALAAHLDWLESGLNPKLRPSLLYGKISLKQAPRGTIRECPVCHEDKLFTHEQQLYCSPACTRRAATLRRGVATSKSRLRTPLYVACPKCGTNIPVAGNTHHASRVDAPGGEAAPNPERQVEEAPNGAGLP